MAKKVSRKAPAKKPVRSSITTSKLARPAVTTNKPARPTVTTSKPTRQAVATNKKKPVVKRSAAASSPLPKRSSVAAPVSKRPSGRPKAAAAARVEAFVDFPPAPIKPGSSGLSRKEIDEFREILMLKRAEIAGDVSTLRDEALSKNRSDSGNLSSMPIHMADLGTDNYEQEFTLGLMESERALLGEIDDALHRIKRGIYGVCEATGRPIGKARLRAKPWAKHCYEYVLAQERGQVRRT